MDSLSLAICHLKDPLQREFYAEMCRIERWSVRTLRAKIASMLYERTALSKKPDELIRHELDALRATDRMTPDLIFKDPYILDFLGLRDHYYERDLEDAILREMEAFLLELGAGFAFLARQRRIQVDSDDFYLDLPLLQSPDCGGWWRSTSSWATSRPATKARWSCTCARAGQA